MSIEAVKVLCVFDCFEQVQRDKDNVCIVIRTGAGFRDLESGIIFYN